MGGRQDGPVDIKGKIEHKRQAGLGDNRKREVADAVQRKG